MKHKNVSSKIEPDGISRFADAIFMRKSSFLQIGIISVIGLNSIALAQSVSVRLASGSGAPGGTVVIPITIASTQGAQTTTVQWSLTYPADITGVAVAIGSSGMSAQKFLSCNGSKCVIIGLNRTTIPDGTVALATFQIASHPSSEAIPIKITGVVAGSVDGRSIPVIALSGSVSMPGLSPTGNRSDVAKGSGNTAKSVHSEPDGANPAP